MPMNRDRSYTPYTAPKAKPAVKAPEKRSGKAEPWAYGPYRVVAQRRVSEEEQLSVECYCQTVSDARVTLGSFLEDFRNHMRTYNEQVVLVQQDQLQKIERLIEERGQEARRIEADIAALVAKKQEISHPDEESADADDSH